MKLNLSFQISGFEPISEDSEKKLVGGFSSSMAGMALPTEGEGSKNCAGGNCVSGCGNGQNVSCNAVPGCGTTPPPKS